MKKFLSMVLAVVMTVSLFTFATTSAGASDYTDADQIQYNEAVDIISALGIMSGYANGTFGPTGGLTRGAAAKIICNMYIGPEAANRLPTNATTFSDVPSNHTFAGPIAYCYEQGFISGYSDGTFRPSDPLSGYAFMKMLLCALGYDQNIEAFVGSNWRINVATKAMDVGIEDNLDANYNPVDAINREQATLLAFNTLQADMVEYDNKSTPVETTTGGSIIINTGSNVARIRTWSSSNNSNAGNINSDLSYDGSYSRNIMQFAELKFSRLRRQETSDSFERPCVKWTLGGEEIGTYANQNDYIVKTYSSSKDLKDIYSDLGMSSNDNKAKLYLNGKPVRWSIEDNGSVTFGRTNYSDTDIQVGKNTSGSIKDLVGRDNALYPTGNADARKNKVDDGCKIEVFYDDDKIFTSGDHIGQDDPDGRVTICVTTYYPGEVTKVTAAKGSDPRKITIADTGSLSESNFKDNNEFETTQFDEDDVVLFSYAGNEIQEVLPTTKVEGNVSRFSAGNFVYLNGTRYNYAGIVNFETGNYVKETETYNTNDEYTIYLNSANQIVWVDSGEFHENTNGTSGYALVRWLDSESRNSRDTNRARLLLSNGTQRTVDLYKDYYKENHTYFDPDGNYLVSYNVAGNGEYRLSTVDNNKWGVWNAVDDYSSTTTENFSIQNRTLSNLKTNTGNRIVADATTVFVIEGNDGTFKTYTGIRNAPNVTASVERDSNGNITSGTVAVAYTDTKRENADTVMTARYVFVTNTGNVTSTSKDVTFIAAASGSDIITEDNDSYRIYNAVVAGRIATLKINAKTSDDVSSTVIEVPAENLNEPLTLDPNGKEATTVNGKDARPTKAWNSVIVNQTNMDDDIVTSADFRSGSLHLYRWQGFKTPRDGQIEVNTHGSSSLKYDLASTVNVYSINKDGDISVTNVSGIYTDNDAWVFCTYDWDEGYITNLFVCEDNS